MLKGLAIAFGDGLAFGVGMKLSQAAATGRQTARKAELAADSGPSEWGALEAIVQTLELRLQEQAGQLDRRLQDFKASLAADLKALDDQDTAIARCVEENLNALRSEIVAMQREFAEAVGRIVSEQVQAQVADRLAEAEQRNAALARRTDGDLQAMRQELAATRTEVAESIGRALTDQVAAAVEAAVRNRLAPMLRFADTMNQACGELAAGVQTAHTDTPTPVPHQPAPSSSEAERLGPHFAQLKRASEMWRVPLVSSLVFTAGVFVLTHYM